MAHPKIAARTSAGNPLFLVATFGDYHTANVHAAHLRAAALRYLGDAADVRVWPHATDAALCCVLSAEPMHATAGPRLAQDVDGQEAADLLTLAALHALWSRGTGTDSLAYAEMVGAALDWLTAWHLRETDDGMAARVALGYAHERCLHAGLVACDEFSPASATVMLDAVNAALWARAKAQRTALDVPASLSTPLPRVDTQKAYEVCVGVEQGQRRSTDRLTVYAASEADANEQARAFSDRCSAWIDETLGCIVSTDVQLATVLSPAPRAPLSLASGRGVDTGAAARIREAA